MARGVEAQPLKLAVEPAIAAILDPLEIAAHMGCAPGSIPCQFGDAVPIIIVRIDGDQGVMGCAAAQRARPGVENPVDRQSLIFSLIFWIGLLQRIGGVVAHEELPGQRLVFRREGVKGGDVVIVRQSILRGVKGIAAVKHPGIAAGLDEEHPHAGLGEAGGHRPPAGARAHDHIVVCRVIRHRLSLLAYNVFRNSISAVLSASDRSAP